MTYLNKILFEGYTAEELLGFPEEQFDAFVFCGEPVVFNIGTAQILGQFSIKGSHLIVELAQIDGGGEGVLPAIGALANNIAKSRNLEIIEWLVHAVTCAKPNLKLRRMLEKRGFQIKQINNIGEVYYQTTDIQ